MGPPEPHQPRQDPAALLRGARILAAALLLGPLLFAAIIAFLKAQGQFASGEQGASEIVGLMGVVVGLSCLPVALLLRHKLLGRALDLARPEEALKATLLFYAILEGGTLLNLVAWLLGAPVLPNVLLAGILMAVGLVWLPRREHFGG